MQIKVVSLNIWRGEILQNLVQFIKDQNADIFLFQEVYDGKDKMLLPPAYRFYEYFKELFPEYHGVYAPVLCDITKHGDIDEGLAIFSKFPVTASKTVFFDIPYTKFDNNAKKSFEDNPQAILLAQFDVNGTPVTAFSVHGVWGTDGLDNPRRLHMGGVIRDFVQGKENVILGGDFNLSSNTETIKIVSQGLQSVFGDSLKSTFNMKHKTNPGYATAAVDMMFVSPQIKIIEKDCPQVDVSDHLPLVVTLEI